MSVIVSRALPDIRDGLKPVHRRVLYAMNDLGIVYNRPHRKSAYVVGEVMAKYHPHGDSAIYETIVRMAQDFMMRYPLADGQGNFGSIDRDPPAHQRYTEVRMARIAQDLLADLDKETVDTALNYDETLHIPEVLPTKVPNLLVNGSSGIAVGMATKHSAAQPHRGGKCLLALLDDPGLAVDDLMHYIPGPDFPTAAIVNGRAGIVRAYRTGRGRIYVRSGTCGRHRRRQGEHRRHGDSVPSQQGADDREDRRSWRRKSASKASPRSATNPTRTACAW